MQPNPKMTYVAILAYDDGKSGVIRTIFDGHSQKPINHKGKWDLLTMARFALQLYWLQECPLPKGRIEIFELANPVLRIGIE